MSDIRFNNWKHQSGTGGVTQNAAGNVGIGSTLPTSALDIGGDIVITGVTTSSNFKTGSSNLHNVGIEIAGINVLGADTPIGTGSTIYDDGGARFSGIVTATTFVGALTGTASGNATISSNADNRIITGGSGNALTGESTLTYSNDILLSTSTNFVIKSIDTNASNAENYIQFNAGYITYDSDSSNSTGYSGHYFQADGAEKLRINGSGQLIFDADTNTWINRPAADTLAVTTGGTERLRIDANGNIRLGPGGNNTNSTNYTTLTISNTAGGVVEFLDSGNNNIAGDLIGAEGSGMYLSSKQDTPIIFRTGASNSEKVRISSDGKVGVGGAPSGWQAANTSKVIQIGNASIFNYNDAYFHVGQNFYYDGSNYKYVANGFSSRLIQNAGEFTFIQAASGSANANITWSDRLKIDTTGRITQNGTTSVDTGSALTLKNGNSSSDHTILEVISDPNQYSMIYMGASDDRHKGRIRYKDNDHFMDFYTNNEERMKLYSNGKVGINTDSTAVDSVVYIGSDPGIPALYSAYGMRIMPNGDHNKRISNATGIYALTAGITGNNNWFTVAIGRYHAGTCTMRVGDASSKRSIFFNYDLTAPNYGVAHLNIIANNGAWNTGSADVQLTSSGSYDYAIQVRHNSHYNSNNNSGVYMIFNVA